MTLWKKRVAASVLALLVYEALVLALDRMGLVERLLSPSGAGVALALVAAVSMYALRLALIFVAPGVVAGWVLIAAIEARRSARPR
ncbi:MAG: hypothetical protein EPO40_26740 [Myxococcaceae bacterium]|nr:MAG: hypothetical protein EPO40_26740 [Myxococcaceae bacterium]